MTARPNSSASRSSPTALVQATAIPSGRVTSRAFSNRSRCASAGTSGVAASPSSRLRRQFECRSRHSPVELGPPREGSRAWRFLKIVGIDLMQRQVGPAPAESTEALRGAEPGHAQQHLDRATYHSCHSASWSPRFMSISPIDRCSTRSSLRAAGREIALSRCSPRRTTALAMRSRAMTPFCHSRTQRVECRTGGKGRGKGIARCPTQRWVAAESRRITTSAAGARRSADPGGAARARRPCRGTAPAARRDDRRSARKRALPQASQSASAAVNCRSARWSSWSR